MTEDFMVKPDKVTLDRVLHRGVTEIIVESEFIKLLHEGSPLRLKMGFDPSRPDLHLGHVVGLRKLRDLQTLGHDVILIVGDWTAQIGDPSGESDTRVMLSHAEVKENAETYLRQFFKVIDQDKTQVVYQSEWFGKFDLATVIDLTSKFTVNQFLHRNDFGQRYSQGLPVAVTELLYPLLQAYDSVAIKSDVEFGGSDQKFNLLVGRELQEKMGQRPQHCFIMPLLVGTDGVRKMSKSLNNYVALEDSPREIFGKIMSVPDALVRSYFELLTDCSETYLTEIDAALQQGGTAVMEVKKILAGEIVTQFYSKDESQKAEEEFRQVVQERSIPSDIDEYPIDSQTSGVLHLGEASATVDIRLFLQSAGLSSSTSESRRLLSQGGVSVAGNTLDATPEVELPFGSVIKVGSRRYVRIIHK